MSNSTRDLLCGLSFLIICAVFALQMHELEDVTRVFPQMLIIVIGLGGLWFVGKGLYLKRKEKASASDESEPVAWKNVGIIAAISIVYAVAVGIFGFFTSTASFIFCTSLVLGDKSRGMGHLVKISAAFSIFFCILLWLCFVKLLNVPTPAGIFM